jgi:hypothetical protein
MSAIKDGESKAEMLDRVFLMSTGDDTWDLSDNDCAALEVVMKDRAALLAALKEMLAAADYSVATDDDVAAMLRYGAAVTAAKEAIARAEGK